MPIKIVEIPDVNNTIQKNIHDSVSRNLLRYLGLEGADIVYEGSEGREVAQPDSTVGEQRTLSYGNTDRVVIDYDEQRDVMNRIERAPGADFELPFFKDTDNRISMTPTQVRYDVTVTVRRRAPSRAIVANWCNAIQRILDQDRAVMVTQFDFHYVIPPACLNLAAACYRAMETNVPSGKSLLEYLRWNFSKAVTLISNMAGQGQEYAMRHTACRVVGVITGDGPQQVRDDNQVSWVGEYQYRFSYTRPEAVVLRYPVILNNTLLPEEWWVDQTHPGMSFEDDASSNVHVNAGNQLTPPAEVTLPIYVPACDYPNLNLPSIGGYVPIIIGQLVFDKDEITKPAFLFPLDGIPGVDLDDSTLAYLRDAYCSGKNGKCSVMKIIVYEDGVPLDMDLVGVDCATNEVWLDYLPDLTKNYQFAIALQTDWTILSDCQYDSIRRHPEFVDAVIDTFFPYLRPAIEPETGKTYPTHNLDKVIDLIGGNGITNAGNGGLRPTHPNMGPWGKSIRIMITVMNSRLFTYLDPRYGTRSA